MNKTFYLGIVFAMFILIELSAQHGYLIEPPARSSAWLVDQQFYNCCINYQHNQMFCGGVNKLWYQNGGRCGVCGESWDETKEYERGGSKYLGKVFRTYVSGSAITVGVDITANHRGFFEFRLCNVDGWETEATQECLNATVLRLANTPDMTKYKIEANFRHVSYKLQLPRNITCDHCVLQWKWVTGNSWGTENNVSCVGCGVIQEQFMGCTDIAIKDRPVSVVLSTETTETTTESTISSEIIEETQSTASTIETTVSIESSLTSPIITSTILYSNDSTIFDNQTSTTEAVPLVTSTPISSTTILSSTTTTTSDESRICQSKLEFGDLSDVSVEIEVFCNDMCNNRCKPLIAEFKEDLIKNRANRRPNPDLMACLETCPLLCSCNN